MRRGFTLTELLTATVALAVVAGFVMSTAMYVGGRSRRVKTIGLIKMLHDGCYQYKTLDIITKRFPEDRGGDSSTLHLRLGTRSRYGGLCSVPQNAYDTRPPIVAFSSTMLEGWPTDTQPNPPRRVVDAWRRPILYQAYPGILYAQGVGVPASQANDVFSLWSVGPDGVNNLGQSDDVNNWERVGRVQ